MLVKKHRSPGVGPNEAHGLWHQKTRAQNPPGYSGRSAPPGVWGPRLFCRSVIHAGCNGTWKKYHHRSNPVPMLSSSLTRRAGTPPANWISRTISPCCRCRHVARNSIRSKMSGNICGKTGCQTGSLTIRTRSFPSVVTHGTTSPKDHRKSGPLDTENGPMGSEL